jgi:hypothetical protein
MDKASLQAADVGGGAVGGRAEERQRYGRAMPVRDAHLVDAGA